MKNFIELACRTEAPITPEVIARLNKAARLIHASMGLQTEPGEFTDQLKKWIFYGKEPDWINLLEELGDLFWYVALAIDEIEFITGKVYNFEGVQKMVIDKLQKRYPNKFTEKDALNRDLDAERKELEEKSGLQHQASAYDSLMRSLKTAEEDKDDPHIQAGPQGIQEETPHKQTPPREVVEKREREIAEQGIVRSSIGTFLVLRLDDPDENLSHAARMAAKQFAKDIWHDEDRRRLSEEIKSTVRAIEEEMPPLKGGKG